MHTHLGRPLVPSGATKGVVEGVGNDEVAPAGKEPVHVPLHVGAVEGVGIVLVAADTEALVAVAALATVAGAVRGALAHGAVTALDVRILTGGEVAPYDILAGDAEMGEQVDVVALGRMPRQSDAVSLAPGGDGGVVATVHALIDRPLVVCADGLGVGNLTPEQGGEVSLGVAEGGEVLPKIPRPGDQL